MKELYTEIIINTSPEKVWKVFSDFANYPNWNPFIIKVENEIKLNNKIKIVLQQPNGNSMKFNPTILDYEKNRKLRWLGKLFVAGLFDGEHQFELIDNHDNTTKFIQKEKFNGILVPLFAKSLEKETKLGFELMNRALKDMCEKI